MPSILEEGNSWEEDSIKDKELPYTTRDTRSMANQLNTTQVAVIPPQLTTTEKALYTHFPLEST